MPWVGNWAQFMQVMAAEAVSFDMRAARHVRTAASTKVMKNFFTAGLLALWNLVDAVSRALSSKAWHADNPCVPD